MYKTIIITYTKSDPCILPFACPGFSYVDLSTLTSAISSKQYFAGEESYAFLTLPEGVLKKGSKYRFKLTVNDGSKEGVAKMVVEVRSGPTSGSLAVNKNTVEALFDEVTISGWYIKKNIENASTGSFPF